MNNHSEAQEIEGIVQELWTEAEQDSARPRVITPPPEGYSHLTGTVLNPEERSETGARARLKLRQNHMTSQYRALKGAEPRPEHQTKSERLWLLSWRAADLDTSAGIGSLVRGVMDDVLAIYRWTGPWKDRDWKAPPEITQAAEREIQTAGRRLAQRMGGQQIRIYAKPGDGWRLNFVAQIQEPEAEPDIMAMSRAAKGLRPSQVEGSWRLIELSFFLHQLRATAISPANATAGDQS